MILERVINGEPYSFAANEWGWAVGCRGAKTDRFHRNYQITCSPGGRPLKCSCPHAVHGGKWCKHLREAEVIWRDGISPLERSVEDVESDVPF